MPGRRDAGTPGCRDAGTPGRRDAGTPGRRDAGTPGRRDADQRMEDRWTTYHSPRHEIIEAMGNDDARPATSKSTLVP